MGMNKRVIDCTQECQPGALRSELAMVREELDALRQSIEDQTAVLFGLSDRMVLAVPVNVGKP